MNQVEPELIYADGTLVSCLMKFQLLKLITVLHPVQHRVKQFDR